MGRLLQQGRHTTHRNDFIHNEEKRREQR